MKSLLLNYYLDDSCTCTFPLHRCCSERMKEFCINARNISIKYVINQLDFSFSLSPFNGYILFYFKVGEYKLRNKGLQKYATDGNRILPTSVYFQ